MDKLRQFMKDRNLTQTALAQGTGYDVGHVNRMLRGRRRITRDFALAVREFSAGVLSLDDLLTAKPKNRRAPGRGGRGAR